MMCKGSIAKKDISLQTRKTYFLGECFHEPDSDRQYMQRSCTWDKFCHVWLKETATVLSLLCCVHGTMPAMYCCDLLLLPC